MEGLVTGQDTIWCEHSPSVGGAAKVSTRDASWLAGYFQLGQSSPFADLNGTCLVEATDAAIAAPPIKLIAKCGGT